MSWGGRREGELWTNTTTMSVLKNKRVCPRNFLTWNWSLREYIGWYEATYIQFESPLGDWDSHHFTTHSFSGQTWGQKPPKNELTAAFLGFFLVNFRRWLSCQPSLQVFRSAQREEFYRTFWGLVFLKSRKWNFNELKNDTRLPSGPERLPSGTEILKW